MVVIEGRRRTASPVTVLSSLPGVSPTTGCRAPGWAAPPPWPCVEGHVSGRWTRAERDRPGGGLLDHGGPTHVWSEPREKWRLGHVVTVSHGAGAEPGSPGYDRSV